MVKKTGLLIRNQVAVPTDGENANVGITLSHETWAKLLGRKVNLSEALSSNMVSTDADMNEVLAFTFDHTSLSR